MNPPPFGGTFGAAANGSERKSNRGHRGSTHLTDSREYYPQTDIALQIDARRGAKYISHVCLSCLSCLSCFTIVLSSLSSPSPNMTLLTCGNFAYSCISICLPFPHLETSRYSTFSRCPSVMLMFTWINNMLMFTWINNIHRNRRYLPS